MKGSNGGGIAPRSCGEGVIVVDVLEEKQFTFVGDSVVIIFSYDAKQNPRYISFKVARVMLHPENYEP